jgi:hypothetical protein
MDTPTASTITTSPRIVSAVGLAHMPGHNTIRRDIARLFMRAFVYLLFRGYIPLRARQRVMFGILNFRARFLSRPILAGGVKGSTFDNDLLKLIFQAVAISLIADNAATTPLTNLFVALHTADPGAGGSQTTSEANYTGYTRATVARTSGGWTVTSASVSPAANINFPAGTAGAGTVTNFSIGTVLSGAGKILYTGTVTPNIVTGNGITPQLTTASAVTEA